MFDPIAIRSEGNINTFEASSPVQNQNKSNQLSSTMDRNLTY
jgi:hypothetical protein